MGIPERGGEVRVVVGNRRKHAASEGERARSCGSGDLNRCAEIYDGLAHEYAHQMIDHAVEHVHGNVHTNGLENFWSLLKRAIKGTYVSGEPFHLYRYLDEQAFRYNNRGNRAEPMTDAQRFQAALSQIVGKRLTYAEVTGKVGETAF